MTIKRKSKMSTVVSSSSDCVDNTACRLRKIGSATSLHTTRTVAPPSTNINNNAISSSTSGPNNINNSSSTNKQCCFHWCCCCRPCSCLAVKAVQEEPKPQKEEHNSSENILITADEPPPSSEEIRLWGDSFDRLMKSQAGRRIFKEFLRCEYSEENILFWEACEDLKKETNPNVVEERARFIYEDFISILSPKEVSLDSKVRDLINKNMNSPTIHTFDEAQTQIYTLMHRDSYPRFLNSDKYKRLLNPPASSENDSESTKGSVKGGSTKDSSSRASSVRRKKSETEFGYVCGGEYGEMSIQTSMVQM